MINIFLLGISLKIKIVALKRLLLQKTKFFYKINFFSFFKKYYFISFKFNYFELQFWHLVFAVFLFYDTILLTIIKSDISKA